ncbi:hypothetical protein K7432_005770 [Basidiobolus ranarum]|uniref:Ribosomal protein S13 n=1 Tax=Basidiobolus ranarum TaxID=34480 RepID=A0ABR2W2Q9_9FUNG
MLHLLGVNLPDKKVVRIALTYFYGIGHSTAEKLCNRLSIHKECKLSELSDTQINQLSGLLTDMTIESDLRRQIKNNVLHLRQINSYVGKRHALGLPVHGQRTRTNSKTARKLNGRFLKQASRGFSSMPDYSSAIEQKTPFEAFFTKKWF